MFKASRRAEPSGQSRDRRIVPPGTTQPRVSAKPAVSGAFRAVKPADFGGVRDMGSQSGNNGRSVHAAGLRPPDRAVMPGGPCGRPFHRSCHRNLPGVAGDLSGAVPVCGVDLVVPDLGLPPMRGPASPECSVLAARILSDATEDTGPVFRKERARALFGRHRTAPPKRLAQIRHDIGDPPAHRLKVGAGPDGAFIHVKRPVHLDLHDMATP